MSTEYFVDSFVRGVRRPSTKLHIFVDSFIIQHVDPLQNSILTEKIYLFLFQVVRNYRKPLVIVAPKVLLRLADAVSPLSDLTPGTHFKNVIGKLLRLKLVEVQVQPIPKVLLTYFATMHCSANICIAFNLNIGSLRHTTLLYATLLFK